MSRTHLDSKSSEYATWADMRARCLNKNHHAFDSYGGRGIKVCERWNHYEAFLQDMGRRPRNHQLDRLNNDGDYSPENCRWATRKQQCRNRRNSRYIEAFGQKKTIPEWAELTGLSYYAIRNRLKIGDDIERIFRPKELPRDPRLNRRKPIKHGNLTRYSNYGCRCVLCRSAVAEYSRRRRSRLRSADAR